MAYYEPQAWQAPMRPASWEQPTPPSRSGMFVHTVGGRTDLQLTYWDKQAPALARSAMTALHSPLNSMVRNKSFSVIRIHFTTIQLALLQILCRSVRQSGYSVGL
jgi:hypothetical protein